MTDSQNAKPFQTGFGARIRRLREDRGLSLRALADRCGLSVNAISLIERGESSPTVSSLHLLSGALGVSIVDFFEEAEKQSSVCVEREQRLSHEKNGVLMESLGTGLRGQQLAPFLITLEPGAGANDLVTHPGQEFAHCLKGLIEYRVADKVHRLRPGDSLLLEAGSPHSFRNTSSKRATFLLVFQATGNTDVGRQRHLAE